MYPFITVWWQHIEMTWLGVIVGIIIFSSICYIYAKKMNLIFSHLFYSLPTLILCIYFLGSYSAFLLTTGHIIPYSIIELWQIIIPPNFWFHAWGLAIWITISTLIFLYQLPSKTIRKKRLDVLFLWYSMALIIVWLFFVLGDHMIWLPTSWTLSVYALTPFSEVSKFTAVYPVGIFLSIAAFLSYLISILIFKHQVKEGRWFGWFALFFFLLSLVLLFQSYSKHGVISIGEVRIDINQYILLFLSICYWIWYLYLYKKTKATHLT